MKARAQRSLAGRNAAKARTGAEGAVAKEASSPAAFAAREDATSSMAPDASGSAPSKAEGTAGVSDAVHDAPSIRDAASTLSAAARAYLPSLPHKAGTMLTYVQSQLDMFDERPLCAVDSLVFSWLSYFRLGEGLRAACTPAGISLHELLRAEDFESMFGTSWDPDGSRELLFAACASPRFREVRLCDFVFKTDAAQEEQFAAMTFALPSGGIYVAFRGTDSTIVGWKEDLNMAYLCPVPAQEEAQAYLEEALRHHEGPVYVGGHSKGGNLAVYAAASCREDLQERICQVYSHDGPGFSDEFRAGSGFLRIQKRMTKTVPKSSVIGLIMDDGSDSRVVESGGFSIFQHNPFLWEVDGCAFAPADGLTASARYLAATIADWMARFTPEERGRFIDTLFDVIGVTGATRFADIRDSWKESVPAMRAAAEALGPDERAFVQDVLKALARTATIDKVSDAAGSLLATLKPVDDASEEGGGI